MEVFLFIFTKKGNFWFFFIEKKNTAVLKQNTVYDQTSKGVEKLTGRKKTRIRLASTLKQYLSYLRIQKKLIF